MERLKGIVRILRKGEKRLLRHLYSASTNGEERLRLDLFNLIESGRVHTDADAQQKLGGKQSPSAYSHLKARLREDILNVLLLQESAKRIAQANRAAVFECRKKIAQAYVLIFRNEINEGIKILQSAQLIASKYELVGESLMMNQLIREMVHTIKDVDQLGKLNESIRSDLSTWEKILRSEELSFVLTMPHLYKGTNSEFDTGFNDRMIEELHDLFNQTRLAKVGFWYYLAYIESATKEKRYANAIKAGLKFLKLVEKSPSIKSKNNIAGVNQTLGTSYLNEREFKAAVLHFQNADHNFPAAGNNRLMNMEYLFRAQLGLGDYEAALATVNAALTHQRIKAKPATQPRWLYFQSTVQLLSGDVDGAYRTLNRDTYLTRQRDEWNVHFRMLEMIIMVEQGDEEWMEFRIQTLRKFLSRNRKLITPRVKAFLEILSAALRNGLEFDGLGKKVEAVLKQCVEEESGHEWNPEGPEIIRFDHWVRDKRKSQA